MLIESIIMINKNNIDEIEPKELLLKFHDNSVKVG